MCPHKDPTLLLAVSLGLSALPWAAGCKPSVESTVPANHIQGSSSTQVQGGAKEFEILLKKCLIPPEDDRIWFPREDDDRLVELACSSPELYDRLLKKLVDLPEDVFQKAPFFPLVWGTDKLKACQLGEVYTHGLVARVLTERRPRHRAILREAIAFHALHDHAAASSHVPYAQSVAGKLTDFTPTDRQEERWQLVVKAVYSKGYPEARAEVWRQLHADAETPFSPKSLGGLSTLLYLIQSDRGEFRRHVLDGCQELLTKGMGQENPCTAGWLVTSGFRMHRSAFMADEASRFESLLMEAASTARSQTFRAEAIHGLIIMKSGRAGEKLSEWLQRNPSPRVVTEMLRGLRHATHDPSLWDSLAKNVAHPRTRAWCAVRREVQTRERKIGQAVEPYLLEVLRTDKDAEMRRAAIEELVARIRNDVATGKAELLSVMEQAKAILQLVLRDSSIEVRRIFVEALKPYEEYFGFLESDVQDQVRQLFDSVKQFPAGPP